MDTTTCTDLSSQILTNEYLLCAKCVEVRDKFDDIFEMYVELVEHRFEEATEDPCYYCLGEATSKDCYDYLRDYCKQYCSHPSDDPNVIYLWDDLRPKFSWFKPIVHEATNEVLAEMQSSVDSEVDTHDQTDVTHNVQPNEVEEAAVVLPRSLISAEPNMGNVFERQYLYKRGIAWNISHGVGEVLAFEKVPGDFVTALLPFKGFFDYHGVVRTAVEIEVKLNTNPFVCGQLVLAAIPMNFVDEALPGAPLRQSIELMPHSYLNAGFETNAKILIPFVSPHAALVNINKSISPDTHFEEQGFLLYVWNQLQVATGQPGIYEVSIWFRFVDVEFGIKMPSFANTTIYQAGQHAGVLNLLKDVGKGVSNSNIPVLSQVAKVIGGVTGMWDAPILQRATAGESVVTDIPKECLDMRVVSNNYSDASSYESLSLKKYMQTYGRLYVIPWSGLDTTGAELIKVPTTINQVQGSAPFQGKYEVPLFEVSRHFRFWRGSLKFKFHVVATRFHQGQLFVSWTPFGNCATADDARATYYMSIDIGQQNVFEIEIPFVYPVDYMMTSQEQHGTIQVWVQNPLVAPANVSSIVYINVYAAGGDDVELSTYQDPDTSVYQSASSSGLGTGTMWKPLGENNYRRTKRMENHDSIENFLRRPSAARNWTVSGTTNSDYQLIAELPFIPNNEQDNWPCKALMAAGGVRWTITTDLPLNAPMIFAVQMEYRDFTSNVVLHNPPVIGTPTNTSVRAGRNYHALQSTNERVMTYEIPMYSPMEYNSLYRVNDPLCPRPKARVYMYTNQDFAYHAVVMWSAADDFRLFWPLTVPQRTIVARSDKVEECVVEEATNEIPVEMQGLKDTFMSVFQELSDFLGSIRSTVVDSWKEIKEKFSKIKDFLYKGKDTILWFAAIKDVITFITDHLMPTILAIYVAYNDKGPMQYLAFLQLTQVIYKFVSPEKLKEGVEDVKMQGPEDVNDEVISDIVTSMCRNIVSYLLRACGKDDGADYQLYISRKTRHMKKDSLLYCIAVLFHTVEHMWWGPSLNVEWTRLIQQKLLNCITKYNDMASNQLFTGSKLYEKDIHGKSNFDTLEEMYNIVQSTIKDSADVRIQNSLSSSIESMRKLYVEAKRIGSLKPNMPEPLGVFLSGRAGVGKSYLTSAVLPAVLTRMGVVNQRENPTFAIPRGDCDMYWNNYDGQEILILDDALQERDGTDPMTIINFISSVRPAVPAAAIEKKGTTYEGKVFVATSNLSSWNTVNNIIDLDALTRRFPIAYTMTLNKDYEENKHFKVDKFVAELSEIAPGDGELTAQQIADLDALCDKVWEFNPLNLRNGVAATEDKITFSTFVGKIVATVKGRTQNFVAASGVFKRSNKAKMQGDDSSDENSEDETDDEGSELDYETVNDADSLASGAFAEEQRKRFEKLDIVRRDTERKLEWPALGGVSPPIVTRASWPPIFCNLGEKRTPKIGTILQPEDVVKKERVLCTTSINMLLDQYEDEAEVDDDIKTYYRNLITLTLKDTVSVKTEVEKDAAYLQLEPEREKMFNAIMLKPVEKKGKWQGLAKYFVMAGLGALAICGLIKASIALFGKILPILQSYTGDASLAKAKAKLPGVRVPNAVARAMMQNKEEGEYTVVQERIHKNMVILEANFYESVKHVTVSALCLDDRTLVCNQHLVDKIFGTKEEVSVHLKHDNVYVPIKIERVNVANVPINDTVSDLCIIKTRIPIAGMATIWHFIPDNYGFLESRMQEAYIRGGENTANVGDDIRCVVKGYRKFNGAIGTYIEADLDDKTIAGDCGRPYILKSSGFSKPLIGLHACLIPGTTLAGAVPLCREPMRLALETINKKNRKIPLAFEEVDMQLKEARNKYWEADTPLKTLVVNGVPMCHHNPTETSLRKLTWKGKVFKHPEWECDMKPAALKANGVKHPLITNSQKYETTARHAVSYLDHNLVLDHFVTKFTDVGEPEILSTDVAINGDDIMNPLQFGTGCGYWSAFGFKKGKKDFFTDLPQEVDINGTLLPIKRVFSDKAKNHIVPIWNVSFTQRLADCEEMGRNAEVFKTFWISTNKDELRDPQKVSDCKTRVFEQPGLEYTILVRKYFGAFLNYFKTRAGFRFYHGIGAEKEAVWKLYWEELKNHSHVGHAFDYKNFDGTVNQDAFQFFADVVKKFYKHGTQEEHNMRNVLLSALRDGNHIMGPYYFQSRQGNKSGNPFTDVFNSVCNYYIMATAYCCGRRCAGLPTTMAYFDRDIRMLTYGDDIIMTVKPSALEYFNGPLIQQIVALFGYSITDALKTGTIPNCSPLTELTFLKSSFVECENVVLAPMPLKDIYKELCYAPKTCIGDELDLQQRVDNVLRLMAHHGEVAFDRLKHQLRERSIPTGWLSADFSSIIMEINEKQQLASLC
jgi:hypothetical protein